MAHCDWRRVVVMASIIIRAAVAVYLMMFLLILALNASIGPVTPGLALARAALWPVWIATGHPSGTVTVYD